jgi:hypothetical protein
LKKGFFFLVLNFLAKSGISAEHQSASTVFDYLEIYGRQSFAEAPFNEIDGFILSRLAYLPFEDCAGALDAKIFSPEQAGTVFAEWWRMEQPSAEDYQTFIASAIENRRSNSLINVKKNLFFVKHGWFEDHALLSYMGKNAYSRYADMRCTGVVSEIENKGGEEKQFSAITFLFSDFSFIAFRGTDATVAGWKEDLNMAFLIPIPAQERAVQYVRNAGFSGTFRLGGHSKGGNLAVYASIFCGEALQERIAAIYNYDGPGFNLEAHITAKPEYQNIKGKLQNFVPQMSIVGLLLDLTDNYNIVESNNKDMIFQHDVYSWEIAGSAFKRYEKINPGNILIRSILMDWISTLKPYEREEFIVLIGDILAGTGKRTFPEMAEDWRGALIGAMSAWTRINPEAKKRFLSALHFLLRTAGAGVVTAVVKEWLERIPNMKTRDKAVIIEKVRNTFLSLLIFAPLYDFLRSGINGINQLW